MLSREITPKYILEVARRNMLVMALATVLIATAVTIYAVRMPNIYQAETVILVEPQQTVQSAPGRLAITSTMEREGLATLSQQILSRSSLEKIINEVGVYNGMAMEQRVRNVRDNIQLDVVKQDQSGNVGGFKIAFQYSDAKQATQVVNSLAGLFINENTNAREQVLKEKLNFLQEQTDQAKAKLNEQEQKMLELKQKYADVLPEQHDKNMRMVEQLNGQLMANRDALSRGQQQANYLENMLSEYKSAPPAARPSILKTVEPATPPPPPTAVEKQLEESKAQLAELKNKYTDQHPDVVRMNKRINDLEERRAAEAITIPVKVKNTKADEPKETTTTVSPETYASITQINSQLRSLKPEIQQRAATTGRIQSQLSYYQSRLNMPPSAEQELAETARNYNLAKDQFQSISNELLSAQMASDLEGKQKTMLFRVVDPAKQPEKPIKPNRRLIVLIGLLAGLGAGVGLAFYREFSDESLHTESDVESNLKLEVLAAIPKV